MGKEIEVGSDVLKAVDDGVERCSLIALASLSSRGVWGFAVNVSHRKTLICFIKRDKKEIENLFSGGRAPLLIRLGRDRSNSSLSLSLSLVIVIVIVIVIESYR